MVHSHRADHLVGERRAECEGVDAVTEHARGVTLGGPSSATFSGRDGSNLRYGRNQDITDQVRNVAEFMYGKTPLDCLG